MGIEAANTDWTETYKSLIAIATEGFKFCALANGGAAVAILAYLGNAASKANTAPDMRFAMGAFLVGVTLCGVGLLFAYLTQLTRLNIIAERRPVQRDWRLSAAILCAAGSIAAFACGSWLAVAAFR